MLIETAGNLVVSPPRAAFPVAGRPAPFPARNPSSQAPVRLSGEPVSKEIALGLRPWRPSRSWREPGTCSPPNRRVPIWQKMDSLQECVTTYDPVGFADRRDYGRVVADTQTQARFATICRKRPRCEDGIALAILLTSWSSLSIFCTLVQLSHPPAIKVRFLKRRASPRIIEWAESRSEGWRAYGK